jgi:hypothetical protein
MILAATTSKLVVILAGAKTSLDCPFVASWVDITSTASTPGESDGVTNGITQADVVVAPAGSTQRYIKYLSIFNGDTGSITPTVSYSANGTLRTLAKVTLAIGETLIFDGSWKVLDAVGAIKTAMSGTGRLLASYVKSTGSSHVTGPQTTSIRLRMVGGGGGGGGASFSSPNMGFGAGGASGAYAEKIFTVTPNTAYAYAIGAAGTAGANTGGTGGTGGDTTFAVGGVTVTAKGGLGGVGQAAAATLDAALGGAGVISTNGDLNSGGDPGRNSTRFSGILGSSGAGGTSQFGGGGAARKTNGAGIAGFGFGAGGGGAAAVSASAVGGVGTLGCIVIDEYA